MAQNLGKKTSPWPAALPYQGEVGGMAPSLGAERSPFRGYWLLMARRVTGTSMDLPLRSTLR